MHKVYDAVVIGTGPAGGEVAASLKKAGKTVAMIDKREYGGTCPLRGCEPKKVLVEAADARAKVSDMQRQGLYGLPTIDWPELMRFKRTFTDPIPAKAEKYYKDLGIDTYHGQARFTGTNQIAVGNTELQGEVIIIAVGSRPRTLHFPGVEHISTSDDFLETENLPRRIIFIGGGYISFEFAFAAAHAGARPIIINRSSQVLKGFDPDLVNLLVDSCSVDGIVVRNNASPQKVEKNGCVFTMELNESDEVLEAEMIVHGAGRVAELDGLDLDVAGIAYDQDGIICNTYMQTEGNPNVYAAGDVVSGAPMLTPVAVHHAEVVVENILGGNTRKHNCTGVSSCLFTYPPLASVGMTEEEAKEQGIKHIVKFKDATQWSEFRRTGLKCAGYKLIIGEEDGKILGAHLLGRHMDEVVNIFAVAMRAGLSVKDLQQMVWSYPSIGYTIRYMLKNV